MKNILFLLFLGGAVSSIAQTDEMSIYFQDTLGNRDTIVFGYDPDATTGIDSIFGEVNIKGQPLEGLDVRILDYDYYALGYYMSETEDLSTFHTKKQITNHNCDNPLFPAQAMIIPKDAFPISITWDAATAPENCGGGPILTDWYPSIWFDVGCCEFAQAQVYLMGEQDSAYFPLTGMRMVASEGDTVGLLYFSFYDLHSATADLEKQPAISIYPNPITRTFRMECAENWITAVLYDMNGHFVFSWQYDRVLSNELVMPENITNGVYILGVEGEVGRYHKKIIVSK